MVYVRDQLGISSDAVVSAQRGYKRHPDTARLQMQILQVPNSYFFIKGYDQESIKAFYARGGFYRSFLPDAPSEQFTERI